MSKQSEFKEGEIGGPRKVDVLVKEDTLQDRLRKRRMAIEQGDATGQVVADPRPGPDHYRGYTRQK